VFLQVLGSSPQSQITEAAQPDHSETHMMCFAKIH
jgi:hypothetical protein